jgi:hypothetical protein
MSEANADSQSARLDRLKAAEEDTGYKRSQTISYTTFGRDQMTGRVVGFARADLADREAVRCVVVQPAVRSPLVLVDPQTSQQV